MKIDYKIACQPKGACKTALDKMKANPECMDAYSNVQFECATMTYIDCQAETLTSKGNRCAVMGQKNCTQAANYILASKESGGEVKQVIKRAIDVCEGYGKPIFVAVIVAAVLGIIAILSIIVAIYCCMPRRNGQRRDEGLLTESV